MKMRDNPRKETRQLAKRCYELQKKGWIVDDIAHFYDRHVTYIFALLRWYKDQIKENNGNLH